MNDSYIELLKNIFLTLTRNDFFLPENWFHNYVSKLEDYTGGIDEWRKLKGVKMVFEIRDLWPQLPIAMGAIKSKFAIRLA